MAVGALCLLAAALLVASTHRSSHLSSRSQVDLEIAGAPQVLSTGDASGTDVQGKSILDGTNDNLLPLPEGVHPKMSLDDVLEALTRSPDAAYVADRNGLDAEVGIYSNPHALDVDGPISDRIVYVITGARAACRPAGGVVTPTGVRDPGSFVCEATIIADGNTGQPLLLQEIGNPVAADQ